MVWQTLVSVDYSSGTPFDSGAWTGVRYAESMIAVNINSSGVSSNVTYIMNQDSGANYAERSSNNGGSDSPHTSMYNSDNQTYSGEGQLFAHGYYYSIVGVDKFALNHGIQGEDGASNSPNRITSVWKFADTANHFEELSANVGGAPSATWGTSTNLSIIGTD